MACTCNNKLCRHLIVSQSVTYADDLLTINIPAGTYDNNERYCLVIGQDIPTTTTIGSLVGITIGSDADIIYPLVNNNCTNVLASQLRTGNIYPTIVKTNIQSGVFRLLVNMGCTCGSTEPSLPFPTVTTVPATDKGGEQANG